MTIREAVQTALEKNPSLQRTEKSIEVAEESLKVAKGNKKFYVSASGSAGISKYEGSDDSESLSARVSGSVPIYTGNKLESQIKSAELEIDAAKFLLPFATFKDSSASSIERSVLCKLGLLASAI